MRHIIYGDLCGLIVPPSIDEVVSLVAEQIAEAVTAMQPGDFFKLERHDEDDPRGLFSITFSTDA